MRTALGVEEWLHRVTYLHPTVRRRNAPISHVSRRILAPGSWLHHQKTKDLLQFWISRMVDMWGRLDSPSCETARRPTVSRPNNRVVLLIPQTAHTRTW